MVRDCDGRKIDIRLWGRKDVLSIKWHWWIYDRGDGYNKVQILGF